MKSPIQNGKLVINNAANVVAASAVEYKERWQTDNDVVVKKTYYIPACTSLELDSLDCNGILEKKINPYLKGLVGNFKPWRSYTYYGSRVDSLVASVTAIRKNGYISNFNNYWGFNVSNNLVPDYTNNRWVWNSELTKVNSRGQELETMDALNRYTSAQYGFNKNLPVSITQNARYGESMNEGFEDYNYVEAINKETKKYCDNTRYNSFLGLSKTAVIADTAHSGKYSLRVNSNDSSSKFFTIKSTNFESFLLLAKKDTLKILDSTGQKLISKSFEPINSLSNSLDFVQSTSTTTKLNLAFIPLDSFTSSGKYHRINVLYKFYIDVPSNGNYPFVFDFIGTDHTENASATLTAINLTNGTTVSTSTSAYNCFYTYPATGCGGLTDNTTRIICLSKGINEISLTVLSLFTCINSDPYPYNCSQISHYLNLSLTTPYPRYKSLTTLNGCISTKSFAATDSMLNPIFNLAPSKRMQFSAWVKERCAIPCFSTDFTKSKISILSGGVNIAPNSVRRTGTIIEGWQKIEGEFTLPANATSAEVRFVNTNTLPLYVDDIRIHPFNANMKSYVYDPRTLRLAAELDENNYASFYEYDEEGQLVRVKKETIQGIKTIKETRSSKQKKILDLQ
jgi:hypothetical protein